MTVSFEGAIGVFDSGVGGLSVLRHIRAALPAEHLVYFSDAGFAPYGDKPEAAIVNRALAIAAFLVQHGAKAVVVACNTATAAAIDAIRQRYPALTVVGVEPGLKPAAECSVSRIVGVLATSRTLASARFAQLQAQVTASTGARFLLQPCPGLADQIEKGELRSLATARIVERLVRPLLEQGADTLVLGCTHYPFVQTLIEAAASRFTASSPNPAKSPVTLIDTGGAVARQLGAVLRLRSQLRDATLPGTLSACTSGSPGTLSQALRHLLAVTVPVTALTLATGAPDNAANKALPGTHGVSPV
ncbi:MAG: glutamate racemase [Herminiimonas sp.]|nr:glutamate racemase [Herminiimonas sp.]